MKILVTIDFSDITEKVLHQTEALAKSMHAEICLLHVAEPNPDHIVYDYDPAAMYAVDPTEIRDKIAQRFHKEHKLLQQYADELRNSGLNCKALMVQGETVEMILKGVEKLSIDFIVAGSYGKGMISQIFLGSTSEELIKKTSVPVYLVPVDKVD
ncbi:MAG: universal stress protein [Gammaproteobacteria bacterium]|nr:universal stress protein [Gammaproteobacteria bacterium]